MAVPAMPVRALKAELDALKIEYSGVVEKADLVRLLDSCDSGTASGRTAKLAQEPPRAKLAAPPRAKPRGTTLQSSAPLAFLPPLPRHEPLRGKSDAITTSTHTATAVDASTAPSTPPRQGPATPPPRQRTPPRDRTPPPHQDAELPAELPPAALPDSDRTSTMPPPPPPPSQPPSQGVGQEAVQCCDDLDASTMPPPPPPPSQPPSQGAVQESAQCCDDLEDDADLPISAMPVRRLKAELDRLNVEYDGVLEKGELVRLLEKARQQRERVAQGSTLITERSVRATGDGYMGVGEGEQIEVLYVGSEKDPEERDWVYGKRLASEGWLPITCFEPPPSTPEPWRPPPLVNQKVEVTDNDGGGVTVRVAMPRCLELGRLLDKRSLWLPPEHVEVWHNIMDDGNGWLALGVTCVHREGSSGCALDVQKMNGHITLAYLPNDFIPRMPAVVETVQKIVQEFTVQSRTHFVGDFRLNRELIALKDGRKYICLDITVHCGLHATLHRIARTVGAVASDARVSFKQGFHLSILDCSDTVLFMGVE